MSSNYAKEMLSAAIASGRAEHQAREATERMRREAVEASDKKKRDEEARVCLDEILRNGRIFGDIRSSAAAGSRSLLYTPRNKQVLTGSVWHLSTLADALSMIEGLRATYKMDRDHTNTSPNLDIQYVRVEWD